MFQDVGIPAKLKRGKKKDKKEVQRRETMFLTVV